MTWFKIDDRMPDNAKVRRAGTAAIGLWSLAGAWSSGNLTDGFVPKDIAKRWDPSGKLSKKLITVGLWSASELDEEPGYQFHQWDEWQPSKTDVLARRKASADRVARHREKKATRDDDVSNDVGNALHAALVTGSEMTPRPDPSRPKEKRRAPAKPDAGASQPIEHQVTTAAYERVGKAFNFLAVRGIVKWAIHDRKEDGLVVENCIVDLYKMGKPITKQLVGQYLDGIIGGGVTTRPDAPRDHKTGLLVER